MRKISSQAHQAPRRKCVTFSKPITQRAEALIKARGFADYKDLLSVLIREEFERHCPPTISGRGWERQQTKHN